MGEGKTGVERLRELAREWEEHSWSSVGKVRARLLAEIAGQIEREMQASDEVGKVKCEADGAAGPLSRHAMAFALLDDWEREAIKRERERRLGIAGDVSMSAYDLLPEDEREAIAWVREHGGVEELRRMFQDADSRRVETSWATGTWSRRSRSPTTARTCTGACPSPRSACGSVTASASGAPH